MRDLRFAKRGDNNREYLVSRDVLELIEKTVLQINDYVPTDEEIDWLDLQLVQYCKRIKPRFFGQTSAAGESFYEIARNYLSFGCVYQIIIGNLTVIEAAEPMHFGIGISLLRSGSDKQRQIYADALHGMRSNIDDGSVSRCIAELESIFGSERYQLIQLKMHEWIGRIS